MPSPLGFDALVLLSRIGEASAGLLLHLGTHEVSIASRQISICVLARRLIRKRNSCDITSAVFVLG